MQITGGEYIAKLLQMEGVEKVFGIIDGTYFGLYSSLQNYGIELITPRHETTAVHMAGAYARQTGKLGVCIASNGPGVANALAGVAVENAEGNRVLLLTSCRRTGISYPDRGGTFQCFDQTGVIGKMAKYSQEIPDPSRIAEIMRHAFRISFSGRPGVAHVDIPENIVNGKFKFEDELLEPTRYRHMEPMVPASDQVARAARMLANARFPIIHAGCGVVHAEAYEALKNVVDRLYAPVTTSWGGRGVLPESSELSVPMAYVEFTNEVRKAADMVLILGSRVGETDWWGKAPYWRSASEQKTIQVDIEDTCLGRNKPVDLAVQCDVGVFLKLLNEQLATMKDDIDLNSRQETYRKLLVKKEKASQKFEESLKDIGSPMHPAHLAPVCQQVFNKDAICIFDGGNTSIWGLTYYQALYPNQIIYSFKFGMLGSGIGMALGAAVAKPDRQVFCIIGDGAMGFHPQEIETAIRNQLPVIFIVACDKQWGMVKMNQQFALKPLKTVIKKSLDESETINTDFSEIQFDKLAESMGAYGERVSNPEQLKAALQRAIAVGKCSVIHVDVDPVKHMWAPSLIHFKKMHEEPAGK